MGILVRCVKHDICECLEMIKGRMIGRAQYVVSPGSGIYEIARAARVFLQQRKRSADPR